MTAFGRGVFSAEGSDDAVADLDKDSTSRGSLGYVPFMLDQRQRPAYPLSGERLSA